ncbi:MAG: MarR family transcriptional regulator [Clostridia bacterium]|nr:MarR family transcriptional regulator [Clostridia bacterium]
MAEREFPEDVVQIERLVRRIAFHVRQHGRRILGRFDITPPQFDALQILVFHDQLTMGELCQRLYLASSTVTDLVQRMERAGLVQRERDPVDRRLVRLRVLDEGRRVIEAVIRERRAYLEEVLENLAPEERESVRRGLAHLLQVMLDLEGRADLAEEAARPAPADKPARTPGARRVPPASGWAEKA